MSEMTYKIIKDHGDGEIEIEVVLRFVIYKPNTSVLDATEKIQSAMDEIAI